MDWASGLYELQLLLMLIVFIHRDEELLCQGLSLNDDLDRLLSKHDVISSGTAVHPETKKTTSAFLGIGDGSGVSNTSSAKMYKGLFQLFDDAVLLSSLCLVIVCGLGVGSGRAGAGPGASAWPGSGTGPGSGRIGRPYSRAPLPQARSAAAPPPVRLSSVSLSADSRHPCTTRRQPPITHAIG
ncbi:hypothetical protein EJ110_NYTH41742 [Nymphaea thermarum]|nr:hypothetical protein EJ110_NYTH41742 [Nymphaea thermarum]